MKLFPIQSNAYLGIKTFVKLKSKEPINPLRYVQTSSSIFVHFIEHVKHILGQEHTLVTRLVNVVVKRFPLLLINTPASISVDGPKNVANLI